MSKPTARRKDIVLQENVEWTGNLVAPRQNVTTEWTATLNGHLSTGEYVEMDRVAPSAGEALLLLEEAIKDQGWKLS